MKSTLTSKGQVTVPARIREALGIQKGDQLDFRLRKDGLLEVAVVTGRLDDLKGMLPAPPRRLSLAEMEEAIGQGGE